MATPTIGLEYSDLASEVGFLLAYGRDSTAWSASQAADVEAAVQSGYMHFLMPPPLKEDEPAHQWSFLRKQGTITTAADDYDYDLPEDFGGIVGPFTFEPPSYYPPIDLVGEGQIRALKRVAGRPRLAALRPKAGFDGTAALRSEVIFWPTPSSILSIYYPYAVVIDKLSLAKPYPLGGPAYRQLLLEMCLAAAEDQLDEVAGVHQTRAAIQLASSVWADRRAYGPDFFGYNADGSDNGGTAREPRATVVRYDGYPP